MLYTDEYWSKRFNSCDPVRVKNAIKSVYNSYPKECMPQGICDPMYIMNTIAFALGIGDGQGHFSIDE